MSCLSHQLARKLGLRRTGAVLENGLLRMDCYCFGRHRVSAGMAGENSDQIGVKFARQCEWDYSSGQHAFKSG